MVQVDGPPTRIRVVQNCDTAGIDWGLEEYGDRGVRPVASEAGAAADVCVLNRLARGIPDQANVEGLS